MNSNDFVDKQIEEIKKDNKKAAILSWVFTGIVWLLRLLSSGMDMVLSIGGIPLTSLFIVIPLTILTVGITIWAFIRNRQEMFELRDQETRPDIARKIIDGEVQRGEILLERYARPTEQDCIQKFILVPSYLLVRDAKLVAIPTKDITDIDFEFKRGKNVSMNSVHYQIYTKDKMHSFEVNSAEEDCSQRLVDRLNEAIKNIPGNSNLRAQ